MDTLDLPTGWVALWQFFQVTCGQSVEARNCGETNDYRIPQCPPVRKSLQVFFFVEPDDSTRFGKFLPLRWRRTYVRRDVGIYRTIGRGCGGIADRAVRGVVLPSIAAQA